MLNAILAQLPTHNHSTAGGEAQIPTAGLNINANLSFNGFNHTAVGAGQFTPGARTLGLQPYGLFVGADGNLYFETSAPNTNAQVQLTNAAATGPSKLHLGQGQCSVAQINFTTVTVPVKVFPLGATTSGQTADTAFIMPFTGSVAAVSIKTVGTQVATGGTFTVSTTGLAANAVSPAFTFTQMNAGISATFTQGAFPITAGTVMGLTVSTNGATFTGTTNSAVIVDVWVYA